MSAVTPSVIDSVAVIFKLNNEMVLRSIDGLSEEEWWRRPSGAGNPIAWLIGHLTISRAQLLRQVGHAYDPGLGRQFDRGAALGGPETYPARDAIVGAWRETKGHMRDAFGALSESALAAPPTGKSFPGVRTTADLIAFYAFHESYHVGQMGYVRRLLGRGGVAD